MTTKERLQQVPGWLKVAVTVLLTIFGVGVTFGQRYAGLPAQTANHAVDIAAVKVRVTDLERAQNESARQYMRLVCLLALPEESRARVAANPAVLARECDR